MKLRPQSDGWSGILFPGEEVLWQGRPSRRLRIGRVDMGRTGMGLIFVVFSIFWTSQVIEMRPPGFVGVIMPLFGLMFLGIGLYNAGAHLVWRGLKHRFTTYTLTNQRAFVATNVPFLPRQLTAYDIKRDAVVECEDGAPGAVWFDTKHIATSNGSSRMRIGFDNIDSPRAVYDQIRAVQRGMA